MDDPRTGVERALTRISVARPYFDLADLELVGDGIVEATVPSHPTTAPEAGAIEAAQVARHLAILGSCAVALTRDDDSRHHYLATRAHYSRMANAPASVDGPLRAQAIGSWIDKRNARALVTLSDADGRALNLLDVTYTVLAPRMFARLNPPIDLDAIDAATTGAQPTETTETIERRPGGVRVDAGPIPVEMCAGHFPDYPAAPVAIVMGQLCDAAGLAMLDHLGLGPLDSGGGGSEGGHRYRIEEGHVEATGLARAGQRLVLDATYVTPVRGGHRLRGEALADGEVVGEVDVVLSVHGPRVAGTEIEPADVVAAADAAGDGTGGAAGDDRPDRDALIDLEGIRV
ncbi:MAG: hypothetical protein AAGA93_19300 [Actinomycetota bacterium]